MSLRTAVFLAMVLLAAWSFFNWRHAVKVSLVLVVLEGALRKWIVPEAQDLIYFTKDAVLLLAYCGFFASVRYARRFWSLPLGLAVLLSLAAIFGLFQIFNPHLPSLRLGVFGFRAYFIYVPLAVVLPAVFPTDRSLTSFVRRYLLLCIPTGLLALMQFFSPSSSLLNVYARGGGEGITSFGTSSYVRVTSTFSYISGYSYYLLASAFLLLAVFAAIRWRFHLRFYLALGLTLLGMLMTGSRGAVYTLVLSLPIYWLVYLARERQGATVMRGLFAASLLAVLIGTYAPEATGAFRGRALAVADTSSRLVSPFMAPLQSLEHAGFFGRGIGATHQAGAVLMNVVEPFWLEDFRAEAESGRIMFELGPVGFLLIYGARFYFVFVALRAALQLRTRLHRALATGSLLFVLSQLPGAIVFDPIGSLFFWFFVGLLNTAIHLDSLPATVPAASGPAAVAHLGRYSVAVPLNSP